MSDRGRVPRKPPRVEIIDMGKPYDGPFCREEGCPVEAAHAPHAARPRSGRLPTKCAACCAGTPDRCACRTPKIQGSK